MHNTELIADKIEELVASLFQQLGPAETGKIQYTILFNPKKNSTWFIVFFFNDQTKLTKSLENGTCYAAHQFLNNCLEKIPETSEISRSISFEAGNRPEEKSEYDALYDKLLKKNEHAISSKGKTDIQICVQCGHNFDAHKMLCHVNEEEGERKRLEGWMICPEENCNCFGTWGTNFSNKG